MAVKRVALAAGSDEVDACARALRGVAAAWMSSSYVVDIYDVIEESDAVWLVMELVRAPACMRWCGGTDRCRRRRPPPWGWAWWTRWRPRTRSACCTAT